MDGSAHTPDFEQLLEVGLAEYGAGRLDRALAAWQAAQALRPDDTQVRGYLAFVRDHYELIQGQQAEAYRPADPAIPFELGEDDAYLDYDLDLVEPPRAGARGALATALAATMDHIDEGWTYGLKLRWQSSIEGTLRMRL